MPPFIGRKRQHTPEDVTSKDTSNKKPKTKAKTSSEAKKRLDTKPSLEANRKFLEQLEDSSSEGSSLSDVDSDDFEDVLLTETSKGAHHDSDEDMEFEDVVIPTDSAPAPTHDLEITLNKKDDFAARALTDGNKKGPSKIERQIRIATHLMHVQYLMFHNLVRSGWACDAKAQKILVDQLPANLKERVEKWRLASGLSNGDPGRDETPNRRKGHKGKDKGKGKEEPRRQRDWSNNAVRQENGVPDMSHGDPLPRFLKELVIYWKKYFRTTAPALRKQGYKPMNVLQDEIASFSKDSHDPEMHGERVRGISEFRRCAKLLEGSRDVGAQLFVCLLRGLGIEARLVANLQPIGFGWSKAEEAPEKMPKRTVESDDELSLGESEEDSASEDSDSKAMTPASVKSAQTPASIRSATQKPTSAKPTKQTAAPPNSKPKNLAQKEAPKQRSKAAPTRQQPARGSKDIPIDLDSDAHISVNSDSSALSDAQSICSVSIASVDPTTPRRKPNLAFDRKMVFPNTWIEAISPVTHKVIPVDPLVSFTVATTDEQLAAFEPRGKKADKAKQVLAYVIAYNADGTAKDVTTRYLRRHQWPGKTKGMRIPAEKVPVYNRRGKVVRYEQYDWFKTVMSSYGRPGAKRTPADDIEEQTDLKPLEIAKNNADKPVGEIDTLAGYKQSAEFVLERHLRRDEALLPIAQPVRYFTPTAGKSAKANGTAAKPTAKPERVYRRKDVVSVKTAESWHKEGRAVLPDAEPLKTAPIRAVTLVRKREVEEATRMHGKAPEQGLFSRAQTNWIVPDPIVNGVIPKNAYGTIDVFVSRMVPRGAKHVPWRGAVKACKKLKCDFAEAVVGFEFGNRRAVPVTQGVVLAEEWEAAVVEEIQRAEEEKRIKDEGKRADMAVKMWRKFVMGLRIVERVQAEYGPETQGQEERNPFVLRAQRNESAKATGDDVVAPEKAIPRGKKSGPSTKKAKDEDGGGFVIDADDEEPEEQSGGFLVGDDEEEANKGGGSMVDSDTESNDQDGDEDEVSSQDEDDEDEDDQDEEYTD